MQAGSLVGFGLLFVALSWGVSASSALLLWLGHPVLRRTGAATERAAAAGALMIAPLLSAVLTIAVLSQSFSAEHHCLIHEHHPHLCLFHGGAWAETPWAVVVVSLVSAVFAARFGERIRSGWRAYGARRTIEATPHVTKDDVLIVPARSLFCFVAGFASPRIFVSQAAWAKLDETERQALVAHERAHVAQGDLWRRFVLSLVALLGAPIVVKRALDHWKLASEKLCDRRAAEQVGDRAVATALLKLARGDTSHEIAFGGSFTNGASVIDRVETLLRDEPEGRFAAHLLLAMIVGVAAVTIALGVIHADPLHHQLETLLGTI